MPPTPDLEPFRRVAGSGGHLCVVSALRADGTIQSSLVNAGVIRHPTAGGDAIAFVARGDARKLALLRARPRATVVATAGYQWAAVEGEVVLAGPDDALEDIDAERLRLLRREVFTAAGGTHDDWPTYDRVMADERRTVVLLTPRRAYSNR